MDLGRAHRQTLYQQFEVYLEVFVNHINKATSKDHVSTALKSNHPLFIHVREHAFVQSFEYLFRCEDYLIIRGVGGDAKRIDLR